MSTRQSSETKRCSEVKRKGAVKALDSIQMRCPNPLALVSVAVSAGPAIAAHAGWSWQHDDGNGIASTSFAWRHGFGLAAQSSQRSNSSAHELPCPVSPARTEGLAP